MKPAIKTGSEGGKNETEMLMPLHRIKAKYVTTLLRGARALSERLASHLSHPWASDACVVAARAQSASRAAAALARRALQHAGMDR